MSNEQLVYLSSFILFLTWEKRIISLLIIFFIALIDFGSSLFIIFLYLSYNFLLIINNFKKEISLKIFVICISVIFLLTLLVIIF